MRSHGEAADVRQIQPLQMSIPEIAVTTVEYRFRITDGDSTIALFKDEVDFLGLTLV
jgi:hypothetical protein